ncbi:hypothetical protein SDC9_140926 [bioreactor metagenome]|uniref:Uncharacterized protein n=1 Tax=bioreactor metagenome TaxID=1076179 RepID=A0A645DW86_9ZZZZ
MESGAFKRGPRRRRGADDARGGMKHDFAVGADIDQHVAAGGLRLMPPCGEVAADISGDARHGQQRNAAP